MDKYKVSLTSRALRDLDGIYSYIASSLAEPRTALAVVDEIETGICSLALMPCRHPERRSGIYAGKGYRQFFIKNFCVIYRVDEASKRIVVVTVRCSKSSF